MSSLCLPSFLESIVDFIDGVAYVQLGSESSSYLEIYDLRACNFLNIQFVTKMLNSTMYRHDLLDIQFFLFVVVIMQTWMY